MLILLYPLTGRASGSVRYCWKLWSEIVASGLCPKASCADLARNFRESPLLLSLDREWRELNIQTRQRKEKDKPLSGEISPDKFLQQLQKRWQMMTNHMDELTMVQWLNGYPTRATEIKLGFRRLGRSQQLQKLGKARPASLKRSKHPFSRALFQLHSWWPSPLFANWQWLRLPPPNILAAQSMVGSASYTAISCYQSIDCEPAPKTLYNKARAHSYEKKY